MSHRRVGCRFAVGLVVLALVSASSPVHAWGFSIAYWPDNTLHTYPGYEGVLTYYFQNGGAGGGEDMWVRASITLGEEVVWWQEDYDIDGDIDGAIEFLLPYAPGATVPEDLNISVPLCSPEPLYEFTVVASEIVQDSGGGIVIGSGIEHSRYIAVDLPIPEGYPTCPIPEPCTAVLLLTAVLGTALRLRRVKDGRKVA